MAFFRPTEAVKTVGFLLIAGLKTVLWWFGGLRRKEMGDQMRERESPTRGERGSKILLQCGRVHGVPVYLKSVSRWISDKTIVRL